MLDAIYERSRYALSIDYGKPLTPPLSPEEAAWLEGQLADLRGWTVLWGRLQRLLMPQDSWRRRAAR